MSETVLLERKATYLEKIHSNLRIYIDSIIEQKILDKRAKKASSNERSKRRELVSVKNKMLETLMSNPKEVNFDELKRVFAEIGRLNSKIAEIEKPFRDAIKPLKEKEKETFIEIVRAMIENGDLDINKAIEAGLVKIG